MAQGALGPGAVLRFTVMSAARESTRLPIPWLGGALLAAAAASTALSCVVGTRGAEVATPVAPDDERSRRPADVDAEGVQSGDARRDGGEGGGNDDESSSDESAPVGDGDVDPHATASPAMRYASLTPASCERELTRRGIAFRKVDAARGVMQPIRLTGPIGGVTYRSQLPERSRATAAIEIIDCRLALSLDDLAAILRSHDVVEAIHYSVYRPPPRRWPSGKPGKRHGAAMAIDLATLIRKDGTKLDVLRDFHGRRGRRPCGDGSVLQPKSNEALELRSIVCALIDARVFHIALTPGFNRRHENHLHLELSTSAKWFYVR